MFNSVNAFQADQEMFNQGHNTDVVAFPKNSKQLKNGSIFSLRDQVKVCRIIDKRVKNNKATTYRMQNRGKSITVESNHADELGMKKQKKGPFNDKR